MGPALQCVVNESFSSNQSLLRTTPTPIIIHIYIYIYYYGPTLSCRDESESMHERQSNSSSQVQVLSVTFVLVACLLDDGWIPFVFFSSGKWMNKQIIEWTPNEWRGWMDGIWVSRPPSVPQIPPHYLIYRGCGELSPSPAPPCNQLPKKTKKEIF